MVVALDQRLLRRQRLWWHWVGCVRCSHVIPALFRKVCRNSLDLGRNIRLGCGTRGSRVDWKWRRRSFRIRTVPPSVVKASKCQFSSSSRIMVRWGHCFWVRAVHTLVPFGFAKSYPGHGSHGRHLGCEA